MKRITFFILLLPVMATFLSAQTLTTRQKHLATLAALEAQGDLLRLEPVNDTQYNEANN